jgi:hypothetical protein
MRIFSPPYQFFLWAALLLLGTSFVVPHRPANIQLHETFFVFDLSVLLRAMALGTFLLWLLYLVNKPFLYSAKMTRIHVMVTLVSVAAVIGTTLWINGMRKELSPADQDLWQAYYRWQQVGNICVVILAAAQVLFLMHLLIGVKRAFRRSSAR